MQDVSISLGPVTMRWFDGLRIGSIDFFKELTQAFESRFITYNRVPWSLDSLLSMTMHDENQQAFKDPLHVPVGPITKARSKKIKEALNGLIQEIWANSNAGHSKLGPKKNEGVINLIQAIDG